MNTYTRFSLQCRGGVHWNDTTDTVTGIDGGESVNTLTIDGKWLTVTGPEATHRIPTHDVMGVTTWNDSANPGQCGNVYFDAHDGADTDNPCIKPAGHEGRHAAATGDKWS